MPYESSPAFPSTALLSASVAARPSRRDLRAADAVLRADVRRRDRIDRHARNALTPPPRRLVGRVLAAVLPVRTRVEGPSL